MSESVATKVQAKSIREYALAFASGADAAAAFAAGCRGDGEPFFTSTYASASPLLRHVFGDVLLRAPVMHWPQARRAWVAAFFNEQKSWEHANAYGLADRYYEWLGKLKPQYRGTSELLIFASLPGEHEAPHSPDVYLGEPRGVTVPATRTLAILWMRELPDRVAGCFEILIPLDKDRLFLFFGQRSVK